MNTLTNIKAAYLVARKEKNEAAKAFYSTLIGEIESNAVLVDGIKTVSEENVIATLKSFEKKNKEFLNIPNLGADQIGKINYELSLIANHLPKQLSEEELREIFANIDHSNMGLMMKHLKENYAGQYDGKLASLVAKEFV